MLNILLWLIKVGLSVLGVLVCLFALVSVFGGWGLVVAVAIAVLWAVHIAFGLHSALVDLVRVLSGR